MFLTTLDALPHWAWPAPGFLIPQPQESVLMPLCLFHAVSSTKGPFPNLCPSKLINFSMLRQVFSVTASPPLPVQINLGWNMGSQLHLVSASCCHGEDPMGGYWLPLFPGFPPQYLMVEVKEGTEHVQLSPFSPLPRATLVKEVACARKSLWGPIRACSDTPTMDMVPSIWEHGSPATCGWCCNSLSQVG